MSLLSFEPKFLSHGDWNVTSTLFIYFDSCGRFLHNFYPIAFSHRRVISVVVGVVNTIWLIFCL